jgi:PAC2 family
MPLYRLEAPLPDLVDPVVLAAFDGWVDAGSAATSVLEILATGAPVIARFDSDELFDYRSRRPTLVIRDGRLASLQWPEVTVRAARFGIRDVLVMTGAEPDDRWHRLADDTVELLRRLGVREWVSLGAIPAAVAHTRPVPILGTASGPGLLRGGVAAGPTGQMQVPAAALSMLEMAVAAGGIPAVGYFAQIPHYVTGPYALAALELVKALELHLEVPLPRGDLAEESRQLRLRLDAATAADEATRSYVERLESMVDEARQPAGDDLIADIERFLRERGSGDA